jgi:hypothetical protein
MGDLPGYWFAPTTARDELVFEAGKEHLLLCKQFAGRKINIRLISGGTGHSTKVIKATGKSALRTIALQNGVLDQHPLTFRLLVKS